MMHGAYSVKLYSWFRTFLLHVHTQIFSILNSSSQLLLKCSGIFYVYRISPFLLVHYSDVWSMFISVELQPNSGLDRLIVEDHTQLDTCTHTHTHTHPVGLPWTNNQLVAEADTYTTQNKFKTGTSMLSVGFEPGNPSSQAATGIGMEQPTLPASSLSVLIPALNSSTYTVSFKPSTARILLFCQRLSGSPQAHFVCNNFFRVGLRTDSGSWPSLTGLRDRTHSIHHTR